MLFRNKNNDKYDELFEQWANHANLTTEAVFTLEAAYRDTAPLKGNKAIAKHFGMLTPGHSLVVDKASLYDIPYTGFFNMMGELVERFGKEAVHFLVLRDRVVIMVLTKEEQAKINAV